MKKIITLLLCGAMALSMSACTQTGGETSGQSSTDSSKSESSVADKNTAETDNLQPVYGKISGITGNEIELSVAKLPEGYGAVDDGDKTESQGDEGGGVAAAMITEAVEGTQGEGYTPPKLELELTGENKTITVPAGVKITGTSGKEEKLSALKKGSVIMLLMDTQTNAVSEISICE